jgi:1,4-dihydroxy-2-naphthoate octaprenyltransferase
MINVKAWVHAARPRTLPLAFTSTLLGSLIAWQDLPFRLPVMILGLVTTLFLQVLSNLANDYGDSVNGMDNELRKGPKRAVQSGDIPLRSMFTGVVITSILALISGILLIAWGFDFRLNAKGIIFFLLGLSALAAAIKYTVGKNPYGYIGFGDLFVFLFFGLTGVLGTYYLHTGRIEPSVLLPASAVGLLSTAVLNLNNMRDRDGDSASGKRTLVVKMGIRKSLAYHTLLIVAAWICFIAYRVTHYTGALQWIFLITLPFFIIHLRKVLTDSSPASLDPELKKLALMTFFTSILFGIF